MATSFVRNEQHHHRVNSCTFQSSHPWSITTIASMKSYNKLDHRNISGIIFTTQCVFAQLKQKRVCVSKSRATMSENNDRLDAQTSADSSSEIKKCKMFYFMGRFRRRKLNIYPWQHKENRQMTLNFNVQTLGVKREELSVSFYIPFRDSFVTINVKWNLHVQKKIYFRGGRE